MPPKNPMTEGEALAVEDVDAIASSLVDWMLTKAMPNGDLLHASVACDYAGMANFKRAVSKQLRAALREQPEARGGVDDAMVERARQAYMATKRWGTGEYPEGPIRSVADLNRNDDDAWRAAITAALASAQAREDELRAACDKWSERELLFGAHEDLQARTERAEASAERWRSRYIAEVVCYRMDQHGDTASEALDAANAVAEKLGHLDKARAALSTNAATQTGETNEAAE